MSVKFFRIVMLGVLLGSCSHAPVVSDGDTSRQTFTPFEGIPSKVIPSDHQTHGEIPRLYFNDAVNSDTVGFAIAFLQQSVKEGATKVVIEWNSPGGSVEDGFLLSKAIESSPVPVVCVVDGYAQSMAAYILQSCTTRLMTKRSFLMMHQPAYRGVAGQPDLLKELSDGLLVLSRAMTEHLAHRSKLSAEEINRQIANGRAWHLGWEEALRSGFVDAVLASPKEADTY